jgi:hypothetical protein
MPKSVRAFRDYKRNESFERKSCDYQNVNT